jgi:large subunit ribosomal protein L30e
MKDTIKEIKEILSKGKFAFGAEQAIKAAKNNALKKIFVCSNCQKDLLDDLKKYSELSGFEVIQLEVSNKELGTIAKKPFSIAVISVMK